MDEPRRPPSSSPDEVETAETEVQLPLWPDEPPLADSGARPAGEVEMPPAVGPDPPWSLADLGVFVVFAFLSFLFANLLAASLFFLIREQVDQRFPLEEVFTQTPFVVSMQAGWEILWFVFIYLLVTRKYRRQFWQALKWVRGPWPGSAYLLAGIAVSILAQLLFYLFPSEKHLPIEKLFSSPESAYLLAFFGICVAPFAEELVFRGFFYPVFERLWGLMVAVVLTALLFACIHVPQLSGGWQEIAAIFAVGMAFSYCRGKTGSLVPPFLMHLAYNASLFVGLYFSTDGFRELKG